MEIYNSTIHGAQGISTPHRTMPSAPSVPIQERPQLDSVTFSEAAKAATLESLYSGETSSSGIRFDLVNRIKREIAAGSYDTPDKMDIAVDRLLARLNPR